MNVCIETNIKPKYSLKTGDVVVNEGEVYLISSFYMDDATSYYVARNMCNGFSGLSGRHDTLEKLQESLPEGTDIYPKDEYELVLRRK